MKAGKYADSKYISATKNKEVDNKTFVIDAIFPEVINGSEKLVMRLRGLEKAMILNKTNINALISGFGDDTDQWVNQKVQLLVITVMFQGTPTDGIQVRAIK